VVQAREANKGHAFLTPPNFLKGHAQSGGQPLPAVLQSRMESFFQTDFSKVRVHVGPQAPSIGALAFTVGTDLYFAPGQYQPNTPGGQQLIGHELTHVVQQAQGRVANPYGSGMAVVHDPGLEEEAERMGKLAAQHRGRGKPTGAQVQRATMGMAAGEKPRGVQRAGGYKLVIGTYLHPKAAQLPEPLAGHSFVSIVQPDGNKKTYGFSPAHYGSYDPRRDLSKLRAGVPGVVHSDEDALSKPGVKVREYDIAPSQAQAAMAKVEEYRSGKHRYNLTNRQCSTFALDVLRAAKVEEPSSTAVSRPRDIYRQLPGEPQIQRAAKPAVQAAEDSDTGDKPPNMAERLKKFVWDEKSRGAMIPQYETKEFRVGDREREAICKGRVKQPRKGGVGMEEVTLTEPYQLTKHLDWLRRKALRRSRDQLWERLGIGQNKDDSQTAGINYVGGAGEDYVGGEKENVHLTVVAKEVPKGSIYLGETVDTILDWVLGPSVHVTRELHTPDPGNSRNPHYYRNKIKINERNSKFHWKVPRGETARYNAEEKALAKILDDQLVRMKQIIKEIRANAFEPIPVDEQKKI
jgi:hypothetical protein